LVPAFSQTPQAPPAPLSAEQVEARIGKLPEDQRAYERFRYWQTMQSEEVQRSPDRMEQYRAYLKGRGFADAEISSQLQLIAGQGRNMEVFRWNRILTSARPSFNTSPNAFLVEMANRRTPGAALDVGMGQGRNAIWLAQNGWKVTGFDPADQAVALANQTAKSLGVELNTEITTSERFDFGENRWDLILFSYVPVRGLTEKIERALKPHGILVIEGSHRDATADHSIGGGVVFDTGELIQLFPDLRVMRYEEPITKADFGSGESRVVRYCGEKVF
jgi:2-polyprenyl-3-methyl-5-hydroxy-6-metoxy-1,4-benzoquinol methylase